MYTSFGGWIPFYGLPMGLDAVMDCMSGPCAPGDVFVPWSMNMTDDRHPELDQLIWSRELSPLQGFLLCAKKSDAIVAFSLFTQTWGATPGC